MVWEAKLHSAKFWISAKANSTIGYEASRSEMERWTGTTQRTRHESCKILHSAKDLGVGIANYIGI